MNANTQQIEFWNGPGGERFARNQDTIDRSLAKITEAVVRLAAPQTDERVLDIGCGCGTTTFWLRELVGAQGAAAGVDISVPMLNVARAKAGASNADVAFIEDDAATHDFQPVFDLVFSRFGVMFFCDPVAALANIRTALTPRDGSCSCAGGRCWKTPGRLPRSPPPSPFCRPWIRPIRWRRDRLHSPMESACAAFLPTLGSRIFRSKDWIRPWPWARRSKMLQSKPLT